MKNEVLQHADLTTFPIIGLVLFVMVAILVCIWIWRRGSDHLYSQMESMALDNDDLAPQMASTSNSKTRSEL